jgi:hypothetical protein
VTDPLPVRPVADAGDRTPVRRLEFVEVPTKTEPHRLRRRSASRTVAARTSTAETEPAIEESVTAGPTEPRWSLWGDTDT